MEDTIKELTLILMYLTSFYSDKYAKEYDVRSAWKGYNFDILNQLNDEELAVGKTRNKSVTLTQDGIELAKQLCQKYNINIK